MKPMILRSLSVAVVILMTSAPILTVASGRNDGNEPPKHRTDDSKAVVAVRAVLDAQVSAWNRGDIEAFMDGYMRGPGTIFVSDDKVIRGWQTVLDRYKKTYDSPEKMGTLQFTDLEITPLCDSAAVALGRWELTRANDAPHGRFTLIFRRTSQGWRIVHDHTSQA